MPNAPEPPEALRVVHLAYADLLPGACLASIRIHRSLLDLGVDSHMVVARRLSDDPTVHGPRGRWEEGLVRVANRVERAATSRLPGAEQSLGMMGSARVGAVARLEPSIVQLHWLAGGLLRPTALKALPEVPVVWRLADMWPFSGTSHYTSDPAPVGFAARLDDWARRRKRRAFTPIPDLTLVAPSRWLADQAARSDVFAGRPVEVIRTGIDVDVFRPLDRAAARAELGIDPGAAVVAFGASGGGTNPRKGRDLLLEALEGATDLPAGSVLLTFGKRDPAHVFGDHKALQLGHIDDPAELRVAYAAADVFVAPSRQENLANTVLESLACGTPVVAFDIGGMREAIDHASTGWLARPLDVRDLAAGIRWALAAGPPIRESCRRTALARFDGRVQAGEWRSLYERLHSSC